MRMKVVGRLLVLILISVFLAVGALAGDDPSIPTSEKEKIKNTMMNYIKSHLTRHDHFLLLDPKTKKTRRLKFDHVHEGVVKHHDGFVACVDMIDGDSIVDVDFVVSIDDGDYRVSKVAIHKVDGEKRKGHLDH